MGGGFVGQPSAGRFIPLGGFVGFVIRHRPAGLTGLPPAGTTPTLGDGNGDPPGAGSGRWRRRSSPRAPGGRCPGRCAPPVPLLLEFEATREQRGKGENSSPAPPFLSARAGRGRRRMPSERPAPYPPPLSPPRYTCSARRWSRRSESSGPRRNCRARSLPSSLPLHPGGSRWSAGRAGDTTSCACSPGGTRRGRSNSAFQGAPNRATEGGLTWGMCSSHSSGC